MMGHKNLINYWLQHNSQRYRFQCVIYLSICRSFFRLASTCPKIESTLKPSLKSRYNVILITLLFYIQYLIKPYNYVQNMHHVSSQDLRENVNHFCLNPSWHKVDFSIGLIKAINSRVKHNYKLKCFNLHWV